mmetsp:Transcript_1658/g.2932  ORF Transcript_1658/g.2932 Transcript_1658/m.2932 type:complete len:125 (-) Transcript_1658:54-428(-)
MSFLCHLHFERVQSASITSESQSIKIDYNDLTTHNWLTNIVASISKLVMLSDYGFSYVTCADKFWELVALTCLASTIFTYQALSMLFVWYLWSSHKAQERHFRYIAEYRFKYPQERTALIPFII